MSKLYLHTFGIPLDYESIEDLIDHRGRIERALLDLNESCVRKSLNQDYDMISNLIMQKNSEV